MLEQYKAVAKQQLNGLGQAANAQNAQWLINAVPGATTYTSANLNFR